MTVLQQAGTAAAAVPLPHQQLLAAAAAAVATAWRGLLAAAPAVPTAPTLLPKPKLLLLEEQQVKPAADVWWWDSAQTRALLASSSMRPADSALSIQLPGCHGAGTAAGLDRLVPWVRGGGVARFWSCEWTVRVKKRPMAAQKKVAAARRSQWKFFDRDAPEGRACSPFSPPAVLAHTPAAAPHPPTPTISTHSKQPLLIPRPPVRLAFSSAVARCVGRGSAS